ncbi:hypothetical protein [Sphingomonas sp. 28-62-11]|uniref:hypothetical protein n=1 Tax=Sphingomonas sp. 28-62-11 TaxID=1970432 RepID=UPI000BCE2B8A|nr:MAG: hypothetical protein B7Y49_02110 [Sphingomonas sp. 28-62-11]
MACWDIGIRNIVDVDGQLLAFDADIVDPAALLSRAKRPADRQLWLVRAGERLAVRPDQPLRLTQDEVLFFETSSASAPALRLAA